MPNSPTSRVWTPQARPSRRDRGRACPTPHRFKARIVPTLPGMHEPSPPNGTAQTCLGRIYCLALHSLAPKAPGFRSLLPLISGPPGGRDLRAKGLHLLEQISVGQDLSGGPSVMPVVNCCAPQPCVPTLPRAPGLSLAHRSDRLNHTGKSFTSWTGTSQNCFLSLPWPLGNSG